MDYSIKTVPMLAKMCGCTKQYIHLCIKDKSKKLKPLCMVGGSYVFSEGTAKKFQEKYFPIK